MENEKDTPELVIAEMLCWMGSGGGDLPPIDILNRASDFGLVTAVTETGLRWTAKGRELRAKGIESMEAIAASGV